MVNALDIAVGGVSGAAFGSIFDGITEVLRNAAEFTTTHTNIKSTLEALQPLIPQIEGKNNKLFLQDEELKDLKKEMEAGVKRVQELPEASVWMRPFYNKELDGMDKSLERLLRILQVQGVRDVKEALVQVNDCKSNVKKVLDQVNDCKTDVKEVLVQVNDCKTDIVEGFSAWKGKTADQLDQLASNGEETLNLTKRVLEQVERINGPSGFVPISEKVASLVEKEALRSSLPSMGHSVDKALSKTNPHRLTLENLKRATEAFWGRVMLGKVDDDVVKPKCLMAFDEVNSLRIKVEEGTKLIDECSNVVVWTDHNISIYASKLDDLAKFLEASVQRLKRTNSTMPKGFDTQNSRLHLCSPPVFINVPWIKSSIDCC